MADRIQDYNSIIFLGGGCMAERLYNQIEGIEGKLIGVMDLFSDEARKIKFFHEYPIQSPDHFVNDLNDDTAIVVAIGSVEVCRFVDEFITRFGYPTSNLFVVNPYSSLRFFMVTEELAAEPRIALSDNRFDEVGLMFKDDVSHDIFNCLRSAKPYESVSDHYELIK